MKQLQFFEKGSSFQAVKQEFDSLLKHPQALMFIRASLVLLLLMWIVLGAFYRILPPKVPLLFSKPWGEEQLVGKEFLLLLPSSTSLLFIINSRFASVSFSQDKLLSFIFLWTQATLTAFSCFILVRIILLLA